MEVLRYLHVSFVEESVLQVLKVGRFRGKQVCVVRFNGAFVWFHGSTI
jgi:acetolactate synthase regulatory subunit